MAKKNESELEKLRKMREEGTLGDNDAERLAQLEAEDADNKNESVEAEDQDNGVVGEADAPTMEKNAEGELMGDPTRPEGGNR